MTLKQRVRALTGGATIVTLLVLIVADTVHGGITLKPEDKFLLIGIASTLLGLDLLLEQYSVTLSFQEGSEDE